MAKLTRTSRRLRRCTTRTSLLRTRGTGQLAPAGPYCTYAVRVGTSLGRAVRTAYRVQSSEFIRAKKQANRLGKPYKPLPGSI